ncbi:cytochrome b5 [Calliopsis andreniformis]|uniref:cytochrome b5 n=1 Tax=Calliopsis andreniformis TaxID=337506 RepID=UPI003FCDCA74
MVELTRYTLKEVAQRNGREGTSTWIVIHDKVYDVTSYKNQHPGGGELIDEYAGQDATFGFDDFGHSSDASRMLKSYLIGELVDEDKMSFKKKRGAGTKANKIGEGKRRVFLSVLCGNCAS